MQYHWYEAQQFVRLSGVADGQYHIFLGHHSEVAVEYVEGVDEERRCACARQGGRYLGTDMSAFADTRDDDLSFAVINEVDGRVE